MIYNASLRTRTLVPEVMDDPGLDPAAHRAALAGLSRINAISRAGAPIFGAIRDISPRPDLQIVDIACGGGDVAIDLYRRSRLGGLQWQVTGCDISPTALAIASDAARNQSAVVHFLPCDVLNSPLPPADVYVTSLFLHHLTFEQGVALLSAMARQARLGIVVSDLTRSSLALLATQVGVRLLTRSPVVHIDGPRSVRAAFTHAEFLQMAEQAGLANPKLRAIWPFRALLTWSRP
jgi:SAM-dependent methyltransferase